jgi:hypothetical protein
MKLLTPSPSPKERGANSLLTPGPSPKERGANSLLTPGPSPKERGDNSLTPKPRRGGGLNSLNIFVKAIAIGCIVMSCGNSDKPAAAEPQPAAAPASIARLDIARDSVVTLTIPSDVSQSYSVYFPSKAKGPEGTPILICFDPHGDGRLPIDKYKKWADKFGIAIAGSNTSRNGLSAAEGQQIAANMIADISSRLGFDKKNAAICGFSGGAKVAINAIGSDGTIPNLIYAGAVTQLNSSHPLNILGFAGNQDMNYTDLLAFNESILPSYPNSALIEFNGKHEWPDVPTFENAFYWLSFQIARDTKHTDSALVKAFLKSMDQSMSDAEKRGDWGWIASYEEFHTACTFLNGLTDISAYQKKMESISATDPYKKALARKNETLQREANEKRTLQMAFQDQGADWWTKVINGYKASSNPSDKRLLGFVSLAGYSYSNQMLQQQNLDGAERMLAIYELADPTNTDQLYFHAILYAEKNNAALAIKYLQRAVSNGFRDGQKIEAERAFSALRNDPNFSQIAASLKKASK